MQKNMTDRTPGSYDDFVAYLGTVRTEEELFSRLTYWFAGQDRPEDVLSRSELVEARAKELGFWQGLTFRMERWLTDGKSELEAVGREEFQSRIAEDYAAYREKADAARARFRDRRRAAPFNFTPDCLENVPIQNVSWLVDGLLPMGEVSLLGADGGTGKGIWQAQLIAYVTAGKTSGFFPLPPQQTGKVLLLAGEDDPGKVLKARLLAAGADMNRVLVLTADDYFGKTGQPLTLKDQALADFAAKAGPLLLIVDPLQSFLPADVEMASRNQMRSALLPLRAIAAKQGCAVLIVMHSNKKQGVSGRARLADSSDIWDMARSVLMMGRAKNDGKIYLSHEKSSYARPQQTVLLHIDDVEVEGVKTARAVFDGYTDKKDADFIEERRVRTAETRQDTRSAILNVLSESRLGSMANPQLKSAVLQEIKCSEATYKRSYAELVRDGDIAKYQLCQKDGARGWFTRLAYRGETHDTVRNI
jgi:RecA-family ATPase